MPTERAAEYGLASGQASEETEAQPASRPAGVTGREVKVLRLVASGLTNAQVAKELYISPRTVNAYLGSVYSKLGFNTRAGAARFASEHDLL